MRFIAFPTVCLVGSLALQTQAFSPVVRSQSAKRAATTPLHVAPIIGPEHIPDADTLTAAADQLQHYLTSSSTLLSDAAAATADAVQEAAKDTEGGWWNSYLEFMKGGLSLIHSVIEEPLRKAGFEQTWGPSIFLFTASARSLLVPLSLQQSKSSEYVKALKPYQDEIKAKFKDNKDMQNRAIAKLYEDANTNPLAGCLVSLAQLPIFLGLYRSVTRLAREGVIDEPFLWIPSLEGPVTAPDYRGLEWLTQGWTTLDGALPTPSLGWETTIRFMIMPLILVLGQSLTMNVLQPPVDDNLPEEEKEQLERTQVILKFLPLMIGFFSLQVPAGLTIYWFTSNFFTLGQSLAVRKYYELNPPDIDLPEYWDALDDMSNMSPDERRAAAEAGIAAGPKWSDIIDEANFHYVVDRSPLREESEAWQRAQADGMKIPEEMVSWVASAGAPIDPKEEEGINAEQQMETAKA
uniref:Membrane insertase YidC/Oxa/ALB C-terminal domain-containing protein n=1 Tax=Minutocellus polymorphus TaxID=265543 RepID=A0A7S0ADY3_9STRA|mmetsp:Transcript_11232/g.18683  ORF Transcript_11232/g.18683 Transcript_11232/m.18683 type:complete len:464 (+) Transcript_11232:217-1608(+)